jgi:hypothetical protein
MKAAKPATPRLVVDNTASRGASATSRTSLFTGLSLQEKNEASEGISAVLGAPHHGSASEALGDDMAGPTREEIDAKLKTVGAETDTKIARLEGKLDLVISKLDGVREDGRSTRANMWVIGVSLALLIIGVAAAAPAIFDLGMKVREGISKEIQEQVHKVSPPG